IFALQDGTEIVLAVQNQTEWAALCSTVVRRYELTDDPRFATNEARIANVDELEAILRQSLGSASATIVRSRLARARIAFASVNDPSALWEHEQLRARDRFVATEIPTGHTTTYRAPFNIDGLGEATPVVPALGAHDPDLLAELERRAAARPDS
ncbi:MAG: CoA transferase, partial [Actinomycetota bacterium]